MPRSAAAKGSYWKSRTVKWLEAQGYQVAYLDSPSQLDELLTRVGLTRKVVEVR